jgi:beta-lactamase regulating signal transducer with metallopeptidase domain
MMQLANWLSPETLRLLAQTLLHFLWQGAALAALAYLVMGLCRSASARYAVGVGTIFLMFMAPIGTFVALRAQLDSNKGIAAADSADESAGIPKVTAVAQPRHTPARPQNTPYFAWLVEAWFAGVVLLSLRSAGGFLVVEHLRRKESTPVCDELLDLCLSLQRRMGLDRVVRYCESVRLDAPAVAGWIRPVVLLPITAISGLSEEQLEAVIAHELAHIQRHDAFVHLFQVAVETLLFYHPAVWWIGKRIRAERENCCDDVAVALCGNAFTYADALTRMAEWKGAPQLVLAANSSPLVERVTRILGAQRRVESFRGANLSAGVLCLATALLAGSAFVGNVRHVQAQSPAPTAQVADPSPAAKQTGRVSRIPDTAFVVRPNDADADAPSAPTTTPTPHASPAPSTIASPSANPTPQASPSTPKQSYIDSLKEAGLTNLSVDELIGLKVQGVTGEYVKSMKDLGMNVNVDELIGMKVQGVTPEYVKEMRAVTGQSLDSDALIGLKVQGVTPEYVRQMHELGLKTDADEIIGMKVQGVTPDYVRAMRGLGLRVDSDDIVGMKVQGITSEYVKGFQDIGFKPDTDELIGMKVQGVTPAYIKELQSQGFKVDIDDAIGAKVQGITPEFIAKVRSHGFKDLTLDKLIALKNAGVFDEK